MRARTSSNAPDLMIGYNAGYRASWDGATGVVAGPVFDDNTKAWSGDHCIDPRLVPGRVLLQPVHRRRRIRRSSTSRPPRFGCSASSRPPTWTGGRWLVWYETPSAMALVRALRVAVALAGVAGMRAAAPAPSAGG